MCTGITKTQTDNFNMPLKSDRIQFLQTEISWTIPFGSILNISVFLLKLDPLALLAWTKYKRKVAL